MTDISSDDPGDMVPMSRLSVISYLQDPTVIGYLQVADIHCWKGGGAAP